VCVYTQYISILDSCPYFYLIFTSFSVCVCAIHIYFRFMHLLYIHASMIQYSHLRACMYVHRSLSLALALARIITHSLSLALALTLSRACSLSLSLKRDSAKNSTKDRACVWVCVCGGFTFVGRGGGVGTHRGRVGYMARGYKIVLSTRVRHAWMDMRAQLTCRMREIHLACQMICPYPLLYVCVCVYI